MVAFKFQEPFPLGEDKTEYKHLTDEHVAVEKLAGKEFLRIQPEGLTLIASRAMRDINFFLRPSHQQMVAAILKDPEASENDKFVARTMLKNAVIAAEGRLPFCQDTGTATIVAKKGQYVLTECNDAEMLAAGVFRTYTEENLRYSQVAPLSMYEEKNTGCNLPAQIDIYSTGGSEYRFLFVAKGGGSANKTFLYQQTKALLNPESLMQFLIEKMKSLGTAACPPYHLAFVIGGTSAEACLKTVKLASTGYLDELPTSGNELGRAFRDRELEDQLRQKARECGLGAQFGGKYFVHDVRIVRLPRHGASCPVGMGVSCSADRNVKARIDRQGLWLEQLDENPARWLLEAGETVEAPAVPIDLDRPMAEILAQLARHPVKTRLSLTGKMVVARDIAHALLKERLDAGRGLPNYFKAHPVYYAGPAKTPPGMPSGSFGPTTAGRMDPYVDTFQAAGGSMVMIAKGNRSQQVTDACKNHGGFYLGSIGGPAAILAKENIRSVKVIDFAELGMEAVWEIDVVDFPAFILIDDKGNDFFKML
ncbi:MAG: fumarate hydratase [Candidatus Wallbacteria bacterium]|nr:fumarate hydratase [Candidatus Wallbacteria bacterium]